MKATLLIRERIVYEDTALAELVVWQVPSPVPASRHSFKYRLVYIVDGRRVLGYDNERTKGDHRHIGGREEPYQFISIDRLLADFVADVNEIRRTR